MKTNHFLSLCAISVGLIMTACQKDDMIQRANERGASTSVHARSITPCGEPVSTPLILTTGPDAGTEVGTVTVQNDNDTLCIVVTLLEGLNLTDIQLNVGNCDEIPVDDDGNYDFAAFNLNTGLFDPVGEYVIEIDGADLPFVTGDCFCVALRATVDDEIAWGDGPYQSEGDSDDRAFDYCLQECPPCFEEESAWSDGERYTSRGNWATYTAYEGTELTVILYAGQTLEAGTVHFSDAVDGEVEITITLNEGWSFVDDPDDENVKIQGYSEAPSGNPSQGHFENKSEATDSPYSVTVAEAAFYGVHVDVMQEVPCPE
jgi:hypothetical protein